MEFEKFAELITKVTSENKMLIVCISAVPGKEMEFAMEMSLDDVPPDQFAEAYLTPSVLQVVTELESRLLGVNHDWELQRGELIPA